MQLPSNQIRQSIYNRLSELGKPVNSGTHQLWATPCYYIGNIISLQDGCKSIYGTDNDLTIESIVDFDGTNGSWQQVDIYASEAIDKLVDFDLQLPGFSTVQIRLSNTNQIEEDLSDGRLRYRRVMSFNILLQQSFESYSYNWLIGYDNGNFGFFDGIYGDLTPRNGYTALYLLDNTLIANNPTNTAPAISLNIKGYNDVVNLIGNTPNGDYSNDVDNNLRDLIINNAGDSLQLSIEDFTTSHAMKVGTNGAGSYGFHPSYGKLSPGIIEGVDTYGWYWQNGMNLRVATGGQQVGGSNALYYTINGNTYTAIWNGSEYVTSANSTVYNYISANVNKIIAIDISTTDPNI